MENSAKLKSVLLISLVIGIAFSNISLAHTQIAQPDNIFPFIFSYIKNIFYRITGYATAQGLNYYNCAGGNQLVGDVNGDGLINEDDVNILFEYVDKNVTNICCGDVNNNGKLDFDDIVELNEFVEGKRNCFERGYSCFQKENCTDGIDNDCDNLVDDEDGDCPCPNWSCDYVISNYLDILQRYDENMNGMVDTEELLSAISDFNNNNLSKSEYCAIVNAWEKSCLFCPEGTEEIHRIVRTCSGDECPSFDSDANDKACCDPYKYGYKQYPCVFNGTCYYQSENPIELPTGEIAICTISNSWVDTDKSRNHCMLPYHWVKGGEDHPFGEYDYGNATECCGDDEGEYYIVMNTSAGVKEACCDSPTDALDENGNCIPSATGNLPPEIYNISIHPENPTTEDYINISATVTDNQSTISLCQISVDGKEYQDMVPIDGKYDEKTEGVVKNIGKLSEGGHNITIRCEDSAGNWNESSYFFKVSEIEVTLTIATTKDVYKLGEKVGLTDPPIGSALNELAGTQTKKKVLWKVNKTHKTFGYIVQFKEEPIITKKISLEKRIKAQSELVEKKRKEYESIQITGINIINPFAWWTKHVKGRELSQEKAKLLKLKKELQIKLLQQKLKIQKEHEQFKKELKRFHSGEILGEFKNVFNGIAVNLSADEIEKIKRLKFVKRVYPNYQVKIDLQESLPLCRVLEAWNLKDLHGRGITGKNITIAILDTGIDYTHPDLGNCSEFIRIEESEIPFRISRNGSYSNASFYEVIYEETFQIGKRLSNFDIHFEEVTLSENTMLAVYNEKEEITDGFWGENVKDKRIKVGEGDKFTIKIISYDGGDGEWSFVVDKLIETKTSYPCEKVVGGYDVINGDSDPMDDNGHGTHCAGIAAGKGDYNHNNIYEPEKGEVWGVAPDAKLFAFKVLDESGSGPTSTIIEGIERALDPNQDGNFSDHVDIISMSLGGSGDPDSPLAQAVDNAVKQGVVVVASAGNKGPLPGSALQVPGCAREAITVGAIDKLDRIVDFSSRGLVTWEKEGKTYLLFKPDLVAPGVEICSAQFDEIYKENECIDDKHIAMSGTSMSTPFVAGVAALIKQAHPEWTPKEIKDALLKESTDLETEFNSQGYGRVDAFSSVLTDYADAFLRVKEMYIDGEKVFITLINGRNPAKDVRVKLTSLDTELAKVMKDENFYGEFAPYEEKTGEFELMFLNRSNGRMIPFRMEISSFNFRKNITFSLHRPFAEKVTFSEKLSFSPYTSPAVADIDNDSNNEIITADNSTVYAWNVDGSLKWSVRLVEKPSYSYWIFASPPAIGNLVGDERKEIVVKVWKEDGIGSIFVVGHDGKVLKNFSYYVDKTSIPVLSDMDGDGYDEIIFYEYHSGDNILHVIKYNGSELEGWPQTLPVERFSLCISPAIADLDKDGSLEIVIFAGGKVMVFDKKGEILWAQLVDVSPNYLSSPSIGDIDKDGKPEIVIVGWNGDRWEFGVYVLESNGEIKAGWPKYFQTPLPLKSSPALGDIDNDGKDEIVIATLINDVYVFNDDGTLLPNWPKDLGNLFSGTPTIVDITGDGKKEIILPGAGSSILGLEPYLYIIDSNGNIIGYENIGGTSSPFVDDIDEDGKIDLLYQTNHKLYWYNTYADKYPSAIDWRQFRANNKNTGSTVRQFFQRQKSMINNTGMADIAGYLLMKVQKKVGENWIDVKIVIDDLENGNLRIIRSGEYLPLDRIWSENGGYVATEKGTFRVYVEFRNKKGVPIKTKLGYLKDSYEFTVKG